MSFVYAEKNYIQLQNAKYPITHIYSDTKLTLDEASASIGSHIHTTQSKSME